jgi:hypothetical protein
MLEPSETHTSTDRDVTVLEDSNIYSGFPIPRNQPLC